MKTQVSSLKSSSFLKTVNPKLFGNSWGNLYVQFQCLVLRFHHAMQQLQQEAEWVNINFERKDLNFLQKREVTLPPPMILDKIAFSFAFDLRKQNVTDFSSISLTQNLTTARHCKFLHIASTVAYQTLAAHQCPLPLPTPLLDI